MKQVPLQQQQNSVDSSQRMGSGRRQQVPILNIQMVSSAFLENKGGAPADGAQAPMIFPQQQVQAPGNQATQLENQRMDQAQNIQNLIYNQGINASNGQVDTMSGQKFQWSQNTMQQGIKQPKVVEPPQQQKFMQMPPMVKGFQMDPKINDAQSQPPMKIQMTEVNFSVKCDETQVGDCVALVGSIPELGEWNTEKAVFLETSPETYPLWQTKQKLPKNQIIQYKYLIVSYRTIAGQGGSQATIPISVHWENLGSSYANRRLNTNDKKLIFLNDEMNSKVVIEEYVEDKSGLPSSPNRLTKLSQQVSQASPPMIKNVVASAPPAGPPNMMQNHSPAKNNFVNGAYPSTFQNQNNMIYPTAAAQNTTQMGGTNQFQMPQFQVQNQWQPPQQQNFPQPIQPINAQLQGSFGASGQDVGAPPPLGVAPMQGPQQNMLQQQQPGAMVHQLNQQPVFTSDRRNSVIENLPVPPPIEKVATPQPNRQNSMSGSNEVSQSKQQEQDQKAGSGNNLFVQPQIVRQQSTNSNLSGLNKYAPQVLYNSSKHIQETDNRGSLLSPLAKSNRNYSSQKRSREDSGLKRSNSRMVEEESARNSHRGMIALDNFENPYAIEEIQIDSMEPIILATFLLPYNIERDKHTGQLEIVKCFHNPTLLYGTLENFMHKKYYNFKWIGLVTTLEDMSEKEKTKLNSQFENMGAYPIFMTAEQTAPYLRFYENILRPLFHNFKDLYNQHNEDLQHWKDFVEVNQKFANKIIEVKNMINKQKLYKKEVKSIWIHNNQLIMVPLLVKKSFEKANIGFYFHSPFPSSSHFRIHKFRLEIMKSLLHCDLVAFHLFAYASNFIKTCQRVCNLELEFLKGGSFGINFNGNNVRIRVAHAGVDEQFMKDLTETTIFRKMQQNLRQFMNKQLTDMNNRRIKEGLETLNDNERPLIISCIDSYHPISGLVNKLKSYQLFLQKYPNYRDRIVFVQFVGSVVQAFDRNQDNESQVNNVMQMREKIWKIVNEIHSSFGKNCLIYQESNPPLEKRLSLWTETDIIACGSLKDGLCIQILEYVVCRKMANKFSESAMICSEFAGCNEAMRGVLKYNPFSLTGFEEMLDRALSMSPETKSQNMNAAYGYISLSSMKKWTDGFIKDLKTAHTPNASTYYLGLAFQSKKDGRNFNRVMQENKNFQKLNIETCYHSLIKATKSVIFIEIDSLPHIKFSKDSIPTNEVIEQLHGLLSDQQNYVVILGNQSTTILEGWFKKNTSLNFNSKQFWLVAETGYLYKCGSGSKWHTSTTIDDFSWIQKVKYVMNGYAENIEGSYIDVRESCILWNYRNAEIDHAKLFIHDLYNVIQRTVKGYQVEIIYGDGFLEVKPINVRKTTLIDQLLQKLTKTSKIDWLFYLGNDSEDELVFEFLKSERRCKPYFQKDCHKYISVLEKKPSEAEFYIEDRDKVRPFLQKFQNATQYRKKNRSYADLNAIAGGDNNMKTKNKLTQIASYGNFNQIVSNDLSSYFRTPIEQSMGQLSGKPFIPRSNPNRISFENLSAKHENDCIHELSDEDGSAHDHKEEMTNAQFSQSKRKILSLDDTKNPGNFTKNDIIISNTERPPATEPKEKKSEQE